MKLALMQPYVLPYIGYFALIAEVDRWVVFDQAQYIKGGWINRNRVLKPGGGWQWLNVPVAKHAHDALIGDVAIARDPRWKRRFVSQLQHYRRYAPCFTETIDLVDAILAPDFERIVDLAVHSQAQVCAYLGVPFPVSRLSDHALPMHEIRGPGDWGRVTCKALGADVYVNPVGGRSLFDPAEYQGDGVEIRFLKARRVAYDQGTGASFEPWLSILDVLMFNTAEQARAMLGEVDIEHPSRLAA